VPQVSISPRRWPWRKRAGRIRYKKKRRSAGHVHFAFRAVIAEGEIGKSPVSVGEGQKIYFAKNFKKGSPVKRTLAENLRTDDPYAPLRLLVM